MEYTRSRRKSTRHAAKQFFLILSTFSVVEIVISKLTLKEETLSNLTSSCLINILQTYLNDSKKIALRFDQNRTHQLVVRDLFKMSRLPLMVNQDEIPKGRDLDTRIPSDATVILSERLNITAYLESNLYTTRTVFLTVVWSRADRIKGVLREFFSFNIVNAFVLEVEREKINVHYFIPYAKCNDTEPMILDIWSGNRFKHGRMGRVAKKYPVSNFKGCEFNVSVTNVPPLIIFPKTENIHGSYVLEGIEGYLFKGLAELLNCTFLYKVADDGKNWGFVYPRPSGPIGEVYHRKSMFSGGGPSATLDRFPYLDAVTDSTGISECVGWEIPAGTAKERPVWLLIFVTEFSPGTWVLFGVALFVVPVTYYAFSTVMKPARNHSLLETFLLLFSTSLGITWRRQASPSLNVLFVAWIWYGLVIMTAYESSMKSKLTVPLSHKNVDTYEQLLESGLELYAIDITIRVVFNGNEDPIQKAVGEKVKAVNYTIQEMIDKMMTDRKAAFLREHLTFLYIALRNSTVAESIHTMKFCAYFYYPTLYMQRLCPVEHVVAPFISKLRESGILLYWRRLFVRENTASKPTVIRLTLEHMTAPFIAYGVGMVLSVIAFVAEQIRYIGTRPKRVFKTR